MPRSSLRIESQRRLRAARMKFRERLKHWGPLLGRGYKATALIVFSTLVLFGLLNLICWLVLRPSRHTPSAAEFRRLPESCGCR